MFILPIDKGLLWTAPELTCSGATNLDQVIRSTEKADVYSFGIILSEIISRRAPYSEITVMTIEHIVQAVAHIREPIISLDQMNAANENDKKHAAMSKNVFFLKRNDLKSNVYVSF